MIRTPITQIEFEQTFINEQACLEYLVQTRWPDGIKCSHCGHGKLWPTRDSVYDCAACGRQTRVLAGTIFQDTHLPLMIWFRAIWLIVNQKYGANAMGLTRLLGINYRSTWNLLHKLRRAMVRPGREMLSGTVEIDETYIGGFAEGSPGRSIDSKQSVAIAVEVTDKKIGRIRMKPINSASAEELLPFIQENVEIGSTVITDGWSSYHKVNTLGYKHIVKTIRSNKEALPHVHLVISLLKRWLLGTYQGAVSNKYIDYYLDEYIFRFNRRKSGSRGKLFQRLVEHAVQTPPVRCKEIKEPINNP